MRGHADSEEATLMAARDRWLLIEEDGALWLLRCEGHELHGRIRFP
jgi:hypothetical protein